LIVLLLRLVNSRRLMGQWTNSRLQNGLAWGLAGVIAAATLVLLLSPFISGV
jgi:Mn2+/Fe2+ NRAMP family transporter